MKKTSDFVKSVKHALIDQDKSRNWLIEQVRKSTGLYFDQPYLTKVLSGQLAPPKIIQAMREILSIPN